MRERKSISINLVALYAVPWSDIYLRGSHVSCMKIYCLAHSPRTLQLGLVFHSPEDRCRWAEAKSMRSGEFIYYLEIFNVNKRSVAIFWFEILFYRFFLGKLEHWKHSILMHRYPGSREAKLINAIMFCPLSGRTKKNLNYTTSKELPWQFQLFITSHHSSCLLLTHLFPILCI